MLALSSFVLLLRNTFGVESLVYSDRLQKKLFEPFMAKVEKACPGLVTVLNTMNEEDAARPANYWETKPLQDKVLC